MRKTEAKTNADKETIRDRLFQRGIDGERGRYIDSERDSEGDRCTVGDT